MQEYQSVFHAIWKNKLDALYRYGLTISLFCSISSEAPLVAEILKTQEIRVIRDNSLQLLGNMPHRYETCQLTEHVSVPFVIKKGDKLFVSFGVKPSAAEKSNVAFRFRLRANDAQQKISLSEITLQPQINRKDRGWQNREISLDPYAGKKLIFHFQSEILIGTEKKVKSDRNNEMLWGGFRVGNFQRSAGDYNLIIVSLDALRGDHIGISGYKRDTSPTLDALAKDGVYFKESIAASPWTKPAHMSILTGLSPSSHGQLLPKKQDKNGISLPINILTLAQRLQSNGYVTQAFTGSEYLSAIFGFAHGFDRYVETVGRKNTARPVFEWAEKWLENHKDQKFFLFLHTYEIHDPYLHSELSGKLTGVNGGECSARTYDSGLERKPDISNEFDTEEKRQCLESRYDSGILYTDQFIKGLVKKLDELQLRENTLLVIVSDHGEELFQRHYKMTHAHTLYDELLKTVLIFNQPDRFKSRSVDHFQARHIDVVPTVLDALNIKWDKKEMEGRSLLPILNGE